MSSGAIARLGAAVHPLAHVGGLPDWIPTVPKRSSVACVVVAVVPELKAVLVPDAPAPWSRAATPPNSSAVTQVCPAVGYVMVIDLPPTSGLTLRLDMMSVRSPADPSFTSWSTLYTFPAVSLAEIGAVMEETLPSITEIKMACPAPTPVAAMGRLTLPEVLLTVLCPIRSA